MTTSEIFDALCAKYDPKLVRFRSAVLYECDGTPQVNHVTDSDIRSIESIITRTLEDLITQENNRRASHGQPKRASAVKSEDLGSFLGVNGRL